MWQSSELAEQTQNIESCSSFAHSALNREGRNCHASGQHNLPIQTTDFLSYPIEKFSSFDSFSNTNYSNADLGYDG